MSRGLQALDRRLEAAVSGRSLNRTGRRPAARRPPRRTSLQHEVVSSTVIRPCSRELLPGTLQLVLPPLIHSWGWVRPGSPWMDTHTLTASLPPSPAAPPERRQGAQQRSAKRSKTLSPRAIEGTLLIVIILVSQVLSGRFCIVVGRFSFCLLSPSSPQTHHLYTFLVSRA